LIVEAGQRSRLSRTRRTIGARMLESWREVPHVAGDFELDASAVLELRQRFRRYHGSSLPLEALVAHVAARLLDEFPDFNAHVVGEEVVRHDRRDIGIATDTTRGLLLPVVRHARSLALAEIAAEVRRLIVAARGGELGPNELTGATFTVSNVGALGSIGHASSILPPGTSSFVSLGSGRAVVALRGGQPVERVIIPFTVTVDHRLIDGGPLVRFADRLKEELERVGLPESLVPG
jgi:pyruvate dehydrogenase E2 component (dihydrolipoyllysine-residue acetyltransferase)